MKTVDVNAVFIRRSTCKRQSLVYSFNAKLHFQYSINLSAKLLREAKKLFCSRDYDVMIGAGHYKQKLVLTQS